MITWQATPPRHSGTHPLPRTEDAVEPATIGPGQPSELGGVIPAPDRAFRGRRIVLYGSCSCSRAACWPPLQCCAAGPSPPPRRCSPTRSPGWPGRCAPRGHRVERRRRRHRHEPRRAPSAAARGGSSVAGGASGRATAPTVPRLGPHGPRRRRRAVLVARHGCRASPWSSAGSASSSARSRRTGTPCSTPTASATSPRPATAACTGWPARTGTKADVAVFYPNAYHLVAAAGVPDDRRAHPDGAQRAHRADPRPRGAGAGRDGPPVRRAAGAGRGHRARVSSSSPRSTTCSGAARCCRSPPVWPSPRCSSVLVRGHARRERPPRGPRPAAVVLAAALVGLLVPAPGDPGRRGSCSRADARAALVGAPAASPRGVRQAGRGRHRRRRRCACCSWAVRSQRRQHRGDRAARRAGRRGGRRSSSCSSATAPTPTSSGSRRSGCSASLGVPARRTAVGRRSATPVRRALRPHRGLDGALGASRSPASGGTTAGG